TNTHLLAYSPKAGQWEELRELESARGRDGTQTAGLVYHPTTDSLYRLVETSGRGGLMRLQRLDAAGEFQAETRLSGPFFAGLIGGRVSTVHTKVQLLSVGEALVLVAMVGSNNMIARKNEVETF